MQLRLLSDVLMHNASLVLVIVRILFAVHKLNRLASEERIEASELINVVHVQKAICKCMTKLNANACLTLCK